MFSSLSPTFCRSSDISGAPSSLLCLRFPFPQHCSWHLVFMTWRCCPPATINNAYFKFSRVMPLEFPINTFRTTTTITRNTLFNSPYNTTTTPLLSGSVCLCPSHTRSFILLCALLCFVVSDLVHKKIRNSIYKHVIEKVNTYTHTHIQTHTCNKVKHVGICFYRSMANFVWSLCVPQSCLCVCVLFTQRTPPATAT